MSYFYPPLNWTIFLKLETLFVSIGEWPLKIIYSSHKKNRSNLPLLKYLNKKNLSLIGILVLFHSCAFFLNCWRLQFEIYKLIICDQKNGQNHLALPLSHCPPAIKLGFWFEVILIAFDAPVCLSEVSQFYSEKSRLFPQWGLKCKSQTFRMLKRCQGISSLNQNHLLFLLAICVSAFSVLESELSCWLKQLPEPLGLAPLYTSVPQSREHQHLLEFTVF